MNLSEQLRQIERHPIDAARARRYRVNRRFFELAFGLLRETTQLAWLCSITTHKSAWEMNEAIVGGNMVRMVKLAKSLLQATRDHQAELGWVVARMLVETAINVCYLAREDSEDLFQAYREYSLVHEMQLECDILHNIQERGHELPIETRMLESIGMAYLKSGGKPPELLSRKKNKWGKLTFYQKAKRLEVEDLYDAVYGAPSRNTHGSWQDLLQHHLHWTNEAGFTPDYSSHSVRPQLLFVIPLFMISAVRDHLAFFHLQPWPELEERLTDLEKRIALGDQLHEEFLSRRAARRASSP